MSSYRFCVKDYHAIHRADIQLDGITVLAGENGSGKSTLARWLYYIVKGTNEYERYIEKDAKREIRFLLERIIRVSSLLKKDEANRLKKYVLKVAAELQEEKTSVEDFEERFKEVVYKMDKEFESYFSGPNTQKDLPRLLSLFQIQYTNEDVPNALLNVLNALFTSFYSIVEEAQKRKQARDWESLSGVVAYFVEDGDEWDIDLSFKEDEVELCDEQEFKLPLMLKRAIYYNTIQIKENESLQRYLETPLEQPSPYLHKLKREIQDVIKGTVEYQEEGSIKRKELYYKRNDGLNLPLRQVAAGIISFGYILQLLENGYLQQDTLLVIDEPEAHLHPQWIVELAKILVLLHKNIGTKIMISSHNPDMVAAIQSIARKNGILDKTRFYLTEPMVANPAKYDFKDLGTEIGPIFESFNISISRIQEYGQEEDDDTK